MERPAFVSPDGISKETIERDALQLRPLCKLIDDLLVRKSIAKCPQAGCQAAYFRSHISYGSLTTL